ncbi:DUF559 domain-containing protein [Paenibacillus alkalitolerans]|uniref:DUF559 domain-containing protein n=1 Tax=Paenibacillus alkalitolerans TaxID=2799335 RepID=UPI0018F63390|nr:DUF559 domain-containing protein [Paenibacillus alkalitolerans]
MDLHPAVLEFVKKTEFEAKMKGSFRKELGHSEKRFLQNVWGPCMNYSFEGLYAEYPFKDFKGGLRFVDFLFMLGLIKLIIEIDGYTTHARDISKGDFNDHLIRQNDLLLNGWFLLRFSADMVENHPEKCRAQLMQALGFLWSRHRLMLEATGKASWQQRKQAVYHLAKQNGGIIRPIQISKELSIHRHTAVQWMQKFTEEGIFEAISANQRITSYKLKE